MFVRHMLEPDWVYNDRILSRFTFKKIRFRLAMIIYDPYMWIHIQIEWY